MQNVTFAYINYYEREKIKNIKVYSLILMDSCFWMLDL